MNSKSVIQSKSILGGAGTFALFAILGLFGVHLDKDQTLGVVDTARELWPVAAGLAGGIGVILARIKHVNFDQINWPGLVSALLAVLATLGVDTKDITHIIGETDELQAKLPGLIAGALSIYGVLKAGKPVAIKKATIVPLIMLLPLSLCQCAGIQKAGTAAQVQWQKLSPETRAIIEQRALAAGIAAAQAASSAAQQGKPAKTVLKEASLAVLDSLQTTPSQTAQPVEVDVLP